MLNYWLYPSKMKMHLPKYIEEYLKINLTWIWRFKMVLWHLWRNLQSTKSRNNWKLMKLNLWKIWTQISREKNLEKSTKVQSEKFLKLVFVNWTYNLQNLNLKKVLQILLELLLVELPLVLIFNKIIRLYLFHLLIIYN